MESLTTLAEEARRLAAEAEESWRAAVEAARRAIGTPDAKETAWRSQVAAAAFSVAMATMVLATQRLWADDAAIRNKQFTQFGRLLYEKFADDLEFFDGSDCEEFMNLAADCGLAEYVAYDPLLHGLIDWAEPGDPICRWIKREEEKLKGEGTR